MPTRRMIWAAGTRGELLQLGPLYLKFVASRAPGVEHSFVLTGEQGMAVYQALDGMGLRPHVECDLKHPGDDSTIRLHAVMGDLEQVARDRRATHMIFAGRGSTAAAAALVAHCRPCRAIWLRPEDAAGLVARLPWEAGMENMIASLTPPDRRVDTPSDFDLHALRTHAAAWGGQIAEPDAAGAAIEGRRPGAPSLLVSVNRRLWGMTQFFGPLVKAAADWARACPGADVVVFSAMDMRIEGLVRSMKNRPANLLLGQPLPLPAYLGLLRATGAVVTDSPTLASMALAREIGVVAVGQIAAGDRPSPAGVRDVVEAQISDSGISAFLAGALAGRAAHPERAAPETATATTPDERALLDIHARIEAWLND